MKRATSVIIFTIVIVLLVGIVVFSMGNSPQTNTMRNNTSGSGIQSNVTTTGNAPIIGNTSKVLASELAKHSTQADCWVGYEGKVYDVTKFLPKHPGSAAAIAKYCGTSKEFEAAFTGQHGKSQVSTLIRESTYKGDLA